MKIPVAYGNPIAYRDATRFRLPRPVLTIHPRVAWRAMAGNRLFARLHSFSVERYLDVPSS